MGAGGWGTALAVLWSKRGNAVTLWGHDPARTAAGLGETRENAEYLPGVKLPESIHVTSEIADCRRADLIVFVTPSVALRSSPTIAGRRPRIRRTILLSGTKGIEHGTGMRMTEVLHEIFPDNTVAVLSGPNLAVEISRDLPTAAVLGCRNRAVRRGAASAISAASGSAFTRATKRSASSWAARLKNVFAIAAGASDGFGLGDNSKAALVPRSLAELLRLGTAMGGNPRTFYGLSGAGDLIATCFSQHSRNRRVGEKLGRGETLAQISTSTHMVAEGIPTAKSAFECARKLQIETPIIDQIYSVLYEGKRPDQAMQELLGRDQKAERA